MIMKQTLKEQCYEYSEDELNCEPMNQHAADCLVDKMYNTEHCGIKHFPNKHYCDCSEINYYQAKQCALVAEDFAIGFAIWCSKLKIDNWEKELLEIYKKENGL
jgi:hypothetical protein